MGRIGRIPQGVHAGKRAQIPGSKSRISCLNFAAPPRSVRGGRPFFGICPPAREKRDVARLRSKLRGRRQTAPRLSAPSRTQGRDIRPDLLLVLSRTWAFRSRSPRAVWKWLSQRIGTSAACSPVMAVLHPAGIITTKADRQSARRRCCSFNSDLLAGQFVEPLSDRGGVIDD